MAITPASLDLILRAGSKGRAAAAGYPDLIISESMAYRAVGDKLNQVPVRSDSQKIAQWHGVSIPKIYESVEFFRALGYSLDVFDIKEIRGGEIVLDLNYPSDRSAEYDLVIDSGTCEHCFNVGQAIINLANMVKAGGFIVQVFPLNAYNHGFYSVSPTLVKDFYEDNDFEIIDCFGIQNGTYTKFPVDYRGRRMQYPDNSFIQLLARRGEVKPLMYPVQFKYR